MNTTYLLVGILVVAAIAAIFFISAPQQLGEKQNINVSEEEINQIGQYQELNLPEDIVSEELPNPEESIVVDENYIDMDLPESI